MIATTEDVAAAAPAAFIVGLLVGWVVSNRYRIERRNGKGGQVTEEKGSDEQLTDEAREKIATQADLDEAATVEEERKTEAQPTTNDPAEPA